MRIYRRFKSGRKVVMYRGDCLDLLRKIPSNSVDLTVTSPPYCMGKEYERTKRLKGFVRTHLKILPEIIRVTKNGGSICWQIGYHARNGVVTPLDFVLNDLIKQWPDIFLRNRIVWTFGHGMHGSKRLSGRHEIILWYTKGRDHKFNLDSIRVPQKYPGKRFYKGPKKGKFSCNPLGKNPGDVWEIPNVKARHVEKTNHPCQFPIGLVQRLIRALTSANDLVLDPFMGSGTTAAAAILESRRFIGAEIKGKYHRTAIRRCQQAANRSIPYRNLDKPILIPDPNSEVATNPFNKNGKALSNGNGKEKSSNQRHVRLLTGQARRYNARIVLSARS